jgi:CubicO group peptidase (beta-lactamase class C family)
MSILVSLVLVAQQDPAAPPPQLDDATKAKVDKVFAEYDKSSSPGCALGVLRDHKMLYRNAYGSANLDFRLPLTPNSVFDIGSTSKQFAAMAILLLEQDGKLSLDDDVRKYAPEVPKYEATITIRHLLNHTSGLRDYLTLAALALLGPDDFYTDDDVLAMISRQKELNFAPGSDYLYSNTGFFLLSTIVKRASGGKTLRQFAEERILKPLQMSSTHFHDDHAEIVRNRATGYAPDLASSGRFKISMSTLDMVGDGGIYTSVSDLAKWDRNFYTHQVGGKESLERMQTPGKLNDGKPLKYGLGLMVDTYRGVPMVSHGGSWAGFRAELLRFPSEKVSVICLCNLAATNPTLLARSVADIVLGSKFTEPVPPLLSLGPKPRATADKDWQPASLEPYAGTYRSEELGGVLYRFVVEKGSLVLQSRVKRVLQPVSPETFRMGPARIRFEKGGFTVEAGRVRNIRFSRVTTP